MSDIKPTRSELIKLKKKIKLAEKGHDLLKKKKDGLVQEFFRILEEVKKHRGELVESYNTATISLRTAAALEGMNTIESVSYALTENPGIELEVRNIMGVTVPNVSAEFIKKAPNERGYGMIGTSSYVDGTIENWETVLENVIQSVERETVLKRVLYEIEKTKRRVGALEFIVIPNMNSAAGFIEFRLEELERENLFRMKRIKKKRTAKGIGI